MTALAWRALTGMEPGYVETHPFCESPKHLDQRIPGTYVMVLTEYYDDGDDLIQTMCVPCMTIIANDMNTTPEAGAI